MSWLHYLLEANIYLGVFYALYFLLLNKETYYKLNRAYLLCTPVLSYIIPLTQIGWLKSYEDEGQVVTTIIYNRALYKNVATIAPHFTLQNVLVYSYAAGVVVMLTLFIFKIFQLLKLTRVQKSLLNNKYKLVKVDDANTAFSFFNYVFIGTNVSGADTMIRHELVHIKQKHSVDIVFLELVKIINWFNPFIYLLQRSLKTLHEYIADEQTARYENDVLTYSSFLVSNAYGLSGSSISNSFFNYNLLKKRIIMLNQKRSGNLARLKYLAVIPVCVGLLCMSTLAFSKSYGWINILPANNLLSLQTPVTKNPDVLKSKNADTIIRLKLDTPIRLKLDTDKRIPPPPPPAPSKGSKSDKATKVTKVLILSPVKSLDVKNSPVVLADIKGNVTAQGKQLTKVRIISKDLKEEDVQRPQKAPLPEVQVISLDVQKIPPPPANPLDSFYKYIAKHIRYPKSAREGHIAGRIILQFDITNGKIDNLKVTRGLSADLDGEALRVLNNYPGIIPISAGTYSIPIGFQLWGKNNKMVEGQDIHKGNPIAKSSDSAPANSASTSTVKMLNEVVVTSYL
jgi:beta-lactamase regulating signal transducer with metallopeptidase domain/outer membrane biosynthesis protein TonB